MNRILSTIVISVSLAVAPLLAHAAGTPDATIDISGDKTAVGIGYTQMRGTLHFKGGSYPVQVKGLSFGEVGAAKITATGQVYHLARLDDLNGNYTAVSAGVAVGGGGEGTTMENQNGVVINLRGTTQGVDVNVSIDGFSLKLGQ